MLNLISLFAGEKVITEFTQEDVTSMLENLDTTFIWGFASAEEVREFTPDDIALMRDAFDKIMDDDFYCMDIRDDIIAEIRRKLHCKGGIYLPLKEVDIIEDALSHYTGSGDVHGIFSDEEHKKLKSLSDRLLKYSCRLYIPG